MLIKTDDNPTDLGYYLIDQRQVPVSVGQRFLEVATFTCTHCSAVTPMLPERQTPYYKCRGCWHLICDVCAEKKKNGAPCKTIMQQYEEHCEEVQRQASSGLILPLSNGSGSF